MDSLGCNSSVIQRGIFIFMTFQEEILNCMKEAVLKDFKKETNDLGGACIEDAKLQIYNNELDCFEDFILQSDVCESQGETAVIKTLTEAKQIAKTLYPSIQIFLFYGNID